MPAPLAEGGVAPEPAGVELGDSGSRAVRDAVGHDPGEVHVVARVLLQEQVALVIDGHVVGLVETDGLRSVKQQLEGGAELRVVDVGEAKPPQATAVATVAHAGQLRVVADESRQPHPRW